MSRAQLALVDLGLGNTQSVLAALKLASTRAGLEIDVALTDSPARVSDAAGIVVPGQGAFRDGGRALESQLGQAVKHSLASGKPYLGICLGLQLLFESSAEAPSVAGLGYFKGTNRAIPVGTLDDEGFPVKVPHMGWNQLAEAAGGAESLDAAVAAAQWFYFVHTYHAVPDSPSLVAAHSEHGPHRLTAAIARDNVVATQFHPEKSHEAGLDFLAAYLRQFFAT